MMKMKKRVAVVLLFALCLAQIPVAPKAKTKKVKLNLTKVSLLQGATVQLKLLNKKAGAVKWYSKNKKKATVNKKGKVTAKKTGSVVVYAKYKKKQYKCKVTVKAPVKAINMKENNAVFTIGKNLVIDGKQYKIAEDVSEKLGQLLKQYKS